MLFAAEEYIHAGAFQHGGHEPEVVIYHHLRYFAGP